MIIYIDKTIGAHGKKHQFTTDELALFAELALAHRNGRCLLCGDIASIECIMNRIGGFQKDVYKRVRNHNAQMGAIMTSVETLIVISYNDHPDAPEFITSKCRLVKMEDAVNLDLGSACSLIGENLDDCRFYRLLASWYLKKNNIKGISISFEDEQGGGATTNKVFENCVLINHTPALCVVDTDVKFYKTKKYPQVPAMGETAKKVDETFNSLKATTTPPIYDVIFIPVHEIENLIPSCIITQLSPDPKKMKVFLKALQTVRGDNPILYYDFKEGDKKLKKAQAIEYWCEIAEQAGNYSFPCAGSNILVKALEQLDREGSTGQKELYTVSIDSYLIGLWTNIGKTVFSWGCASNKNLA